MDVVVSSMVAAVGAIVLVLRFGVQILARLLPFASCHVTSFQTVRHGDLRTNDNGELSSVLSFAERSPFSHCSGLVPTTQGGGRQAARYQRGHRGPRYGERS